MAVSTGAAIAIGAGVSALGGILQGEASKDAAKEQRKAAEKGIAEQRAARLSAEERTQPFADIGLDAAEPLRELLADPMASLEQINPVVDFLREEGFEQIEQRAAAGGRLPSKDLTRFNTELAATVVPQLQQQRFNQLFSVLGLGANAATGQANTALQTGTNIANLQGNVGQANANAAIGRANAITSALQGGAQAIGAFSGPQQSAAPIAPTAGAGAPQNPSQITFNP